MTSRIEVVENFKDKWWRINNLYWIQDEQGHRIKFVCNELQAKAWDDFWFLNIFLKARQFGGTTFVDIYFLDDCLWTRNIEAAIIAHKTDDAEKIFKRKVKYPYDELPLGLKNKIYLTKEQAGGLEFSNRSAIYVTTSVRSGTVQRLHISEHAKICKKFPEKAEEIRTGSLNAIHQGNIIVIESTAEGRYGDFYNFCKKALNMQKKGSPLTMLDFKLHFFPWFWDSKNRMNSRDAGLVEIPKEEAIYFASLEAKGIITTPEGVKCSLSQEQKAWYVKKKEVLREKMVQEFPSTPEEAFMVIIKGAFYTEDMIKLRKEKRLGFVPWEPRLPVNTAWDLGVDGNLAILFHQEHMKENRLIDFFTNKPEEDEDPDDVIDKGLPHYAKMLQSKGYVYGEHFLPHDIEVESISTGKTRLETLQGLLPGQKITPVSKWGVAEGIQAVHNIFPTLFISEDKCEPLVDALDHYQRQPARDGGFLSEPLHNWASHPADSLRTFAVGYETRSMLRKKGRRRRRDAAVI